LLIQPKQSFEKDMDTREPRHVTELVAEEFRARHPNLLSADTLDQDLFPRALAELFEEHRWKPQYLPWDSHPRYRPCDSDDRSLVQHYLASAEIGYLDLALFKILVDHALESSTDAESLLTRSLAQIRVAMSVADTLTENRSHGFLTFQHRWQDVLTVMLGSDEYRDVVESLTVDGVVLDELVVAVFGG
jgi:hypothetical protein